MRIMFDPVLASFVIDDNKGYEGIYQHEIEQVRLEVEGVKGRRYSLGTVFLSRVLGTDFSDYQEFKSFAGIYGPLSFVTMIEDIKQRLTMLKSLADGYGQVKEILGDDMIFHRLYELIRLELLEFQIELVNIRKDTNRPESNMETIRYLCKRAMEYGLTLEPFKPPEGEQVFYLSGKDFRSTVMLLMADEISRKGKLPKPLSGICSRCGNPINPNSYSGLYYCSPKCANLASKERDDLITLKNRVRKKAERKFKDDRPTLLRFRNELNSLIREGDKEGDIKKLCYSFSIDPNPEKAGRPPWKKPQPAKKPQKRKG